MPGFLGGLFRGLRRGSHTVDEEPIREELLSVERLEQFAETLAIEHRVTEGPSRGRRLLPRLERNARELISAYRTLAEAIRQGRTISPAAEWLVDNFHIVEDQLREIREDLPRGYYRELPKLTAGPFSGFPRIYALAIALIGHTDSRLDTETLRRFVRAYQRVAPLTIGELWAVAITLRLALVENLRRLASRIVLSRDERQEADELADKLLDMVERQSDGLVPALADRLGRKEALGRTLVVQLAQRLREQDPAIAPVFDWLERRLRQNGSGLEQAVQLEHQRQAAAQVTVGNIITSMRLLSNLDWRDFFESVSLVDPILAKDPSGIYWKMDFHTRDRYRHVVERIAKRTHIREAEVARTAAELAERSDQANPQDQARAHVGYYLIDDGQRDLEESTKYRPRLRERCRGVVLRYPTTCYLSTLIALAFFIVAVVVGLGYVLGASWQVLIAFGILSFGPATDFAVGVVNWDVTHFIGPRLLAKLDSSKGLPEPAQTFVVVPTLLTSEETVDELFERLEVHYLANKDPNLYFAILGDFSDADQSEKPADAAIIERALDRVDELNKRHGTKEVAQLFHLFHRRRLWNEGEQKWMGWERKRGKLHEFNRLLRGARDTTFSIVTADPALLAETRFCITLDSDTQLPRDAARRLIGVALHPLNRPAYSHQLGRVTRGYSILQPRISVSLESSSRSRFARIFSGHTGLDPYTTAASDVYQDLFGEGIYTGKGLYDIDAFETALDGRVPEYSLLSHDLFEGLYARAGLVSDIELLDDYPARYETFARRQHRWIRGDWQIARWMMPTVRDASGRRVRNTLPAISRWKIIDNLRRSLTPAAFVVWLLFAWTVMPGPTWLWTLLGVLTLTFPVYAHLTTNVFHHPRGIPWSSHFWSVIGDVRLNTKQALLTLVLFAHLAYLTCDAIVRTFYRKLISHRRLLEWVPAAQAERHVRQTLSAMFGYTWPAVAIGVAASGLVLLLKPASILAASPLLLAWLFSPIVAHVVSRRLTVQREELTPPEVNVARVLARRTWRFFETFVGQDDNWLPPDNYQEDPEQIAHRTSPTNVGLLLLGTVACHDLGYVGTLELLERLELTFSSIDRMQKFRGHLFNWYDTRTLTPLLPQYISTVDSGNLAGHLLAVKQSCVDLPDRPIFSADTLRGLADSTSLLAVEMSKLGGVRQRTEAVSISQLRDQINSCERLVNGSVPETMSEWATLFRSLQRHAAEVDDILSVLSMEHGAESFAEVRFWASALIRQAGECIRDSQTLAPWGASLTVHLAPVMELAAKENQTEWQEINDALERVSSFSDLGAAYDSVLTRLAALVDEFDTSIAKNDHTKAAATNRINSLTAAVEDAARAVNGLLARATKLAQRSTELFETMDFRFLVDEERKVFRIGHNVSSDRPDSSYYDLLASESRLASFVAIAKGDVSQEHWFRLGRQLTPVDGSRALISWTATMFEYLMPMLVMRSYDETLLDQTHRAIVLRQIEYGIEHGVPWGVSESAYNARDLHLNYQYGPFGVPGLGLKRGLSEDLVIAPYATLLASLVEPTRSLVNVRRLEREGALARYGFYEAIDYTPERLPQNQKRVLIRAFMAHHQGMILVALDNLLNDNIIQRRFHAEPLVQATELLLQERIPRGAPAAHPRAEEVLSGKVVRTLTGLSTRTFDSADLPTPRVQILSNGTYSVMLTTAGAGYSRSGNLAVTRWREDPVRDHYGSFYYLRDVRSGSVWSCGHQPTLKAPRAYEVTFSEDKVDFRRTDDGIATQTEIIVSPEDNAEIRRISLTNKSTRVREIEVTSYAEVVLAPHAADLAHQAFSNLFIETEFIAAENALLAHRRPRSSKDAPVWAVHVVRTEGEAIGATQYETDRSRFVGRGHTPASPVAVIEERPLSNTVGAVLDPVFSLRQRVRIQPGQTARITFSTGIAQTRDEAMLLADKYHDRVTFEREARLAWTRAQVEMRHLNINTEEAHLFQRLAGRVLYSDPSLRPRPHVLALNTRAQSSLWPYGISGDIPIVLVRINQSEDLNTVRLVLRGHEYLRMKGLQFDLVILNDHPPTYADELEDELRMLIRSSGSQLLQDKPGGVFLRRSEQMPEADRILLHSVARVVVVTERGALEDQLTRRPLEDELPPELVVRVPSRAYPQPPHPTPELSFFNGLGGFREGGREYVTILGEGQWTPAPWSNVVANEHDFGFIVTESGGGYTWSANSRENRLTSWSNDAVSDSPPEIIYMRDEETGSLWTPTPLPVREAEPYMIRHGQGYSAFEHTSHGLSQELLVFVPDDAPVKISVLRLGNRSDRPRRISITQFNELVLGTTRGASAPYLITELSRTRGAIFARNPYNNEFATRVAFVSTSASSFTFTCDRKEFIGRNGTLERPAAMRRTSLSGKSGAGLDPCVAIQTVIDLAPGETREVAFLLGEGESLDEARSVSTKYRQFQAIYEAFERVMARWDDVLETIEVKTPDTTMDTILNRWLLCQTLACRVWARSAFYQSGGAYGFRDQLQDVMALVYSRPEIARAQIVRAASRQFKEGDVQHWWHPPTGRGVRTRFSDDLLWLPYVTSFYVQKTGDSAVLDEDVPFIEAPLLAVGEDESYTQPVVSSEKATVYEHCARTLDRSLEVGAHGLPLMGSGDWNDGMNRVGHEGKGESVWVGWFLHNTLEWFTPFVEGRKDTKRVTKYRAHMEKLKVGLMEKAWDGDWYRRAYFDDGTPLGSVQNDECRIDSIAQSWGVISGASETHRAHRAMAAVEEYLVRRGDGLVILFTPPFDKSPLDPGYIKGYVPGVRENGGQYTHAAIWMVIAYALLGDGDRAGELFGLLNPINHAANRAGLHKYKVEPYVAAADVYAVWPHTGRGGWTWYTGSAGWMYRAALEFILGFQLQTDRLRIEPCIPRYWRQFEINYRHRTSRYHITIENPSNISRGVESIEVDGVKLDSDAIPLKDDGARYEVKITMGERLTVRSTDDAAAETAQKQG